MTRRFPALIVFLLAGCSWRAPLPADRDGPAGAGPEMRCQWLPAATWVHPRADAVRQRLDAVVERAAEAGVQVLFLELPGLGGAPDSPEPPPLLADLRAQGLHPAAHAGQAAQRRGLALHLGVVAPPVPSPGDTAAVAAARTRLQRQVRHLVETCDFDGLHLDMAAAPGERAVATPAALEGALLEGAAVEALLVRPDLVLSTNAAGRDGGPPGDWVERGLVDALVPGPAHGDTVFAVRFPQRRERATRALGLDLSPLVTGDPAGAPISVQAGEWTGTLDSEGRVNCLLAARPDTLRLTVGKMDLALATAYWRPPYRYRARADCTVSRMAPWVELRRGPPDTTAAEYFHFLFRTDSAAVARVNGDTAHVYRTGVFFDSLGLAGGVNRVRVEALFPDSSRAVYERRYVRRQAVARSPFPLWIDADAATPRRDLVLLPEDEVRISFRGSPGQRAWVRLRPGKVRLACERLDRDEYSEYRVDLPLRLLHPGRTHRIEQYLEPAPEAPVRRAITRTLTATVTVRHADEFPLVRTAADESYLSYGQGRVRLGGPYLAEYGPGIVLQTSGRIGDAYRVRLGPHRVGFIPARQVEELPPETARPGYTIYSLHAALSDSGDADVVRLPWTEPVPYVVRPDPAGKRLLITLYGVEASSTWVQHRSGTRYVDQLTWEQVAPETYQVTVHLGDSRIWGYTLEPEGRSLVLRLPHPPRPGAPDAPFAGLRIAIEAGHGGANTGAVGLSGLLEKDVNLDTALRLGELCRSAGMEVCQLRPADEGVPYMARRDSAAAWGAHLLVSIHANAGGTSHGYLRIGGTSTYYHNPFWAPLAERVYDALLELDLEEFGAVGSFNYRNTRTAAMPAVLVEQAFMSHAEDEERLADPAFRQRLAEQVYVGVADYLEDMLQD